MVWSPGVSKRVSGLRFGAGVVDVWIWACGRFCFLELVVDTCIWMCGGGLWFVVRRGRGQGVDLVVW